MNPHSEWVFNRLWKIDKKQKKIPFGIFLRRLVSFFGIAENVLRGLKS